MTGLGGSVSAMQQGCPGEGAKGPGDMGERATVWPWRLCPETPGPTSGLPRSQRSLGLGPEAGVSLSPADAGSIDKVEGMSSSSGQGPTPWYKNKGFQIGTPSPWR